MRRFHQRCVEHARLLDWRLLRMTRAGAAREKYWRSLIFLPQQYYHGISLVLCDQPSMRPSVLQYSTPAIGNRTQYIQEARCSNRSAYV